MKRVIMMLALLCVMTSPHEIEKAEAQVFILSEEEYVDSERPTTSGTFIPVLPQGEGDDWIYTPVGDGLLALVGMAGLYMAGKKRKKKKDFSGKIDHLGKKH